MTRSILADTSVLVAAMVESHPAHARALPWLQRARKKQIRLVTCTHSLAELHAVLTRLPLSPHISPDTARRLIHVNIEAVATLVDLDQHDYRSVLDDMSAYGLSGGVIYDALAACAARKARVDCLLTLNERDFRRVWPDAGKRVASP